MGRELTGFYYRTYNYKTVDTGYFDKSKNSF